MRQWIEPEVRRWWRGESGISGIVMDAVTAPVEHAFRWGVARRNQKYDEGRYPVHRPAVPVISIGNLTVGGTGKTPFTAWLAARLDRAGVRPGIVLRGYGQDELRLHRHWHPTLPSAASSDRIPAIQQVQSAGARVVLLDDGFQHRAVHRDLDLVLVSAEQSLGERSYLLPRGPYREPWSGLARADAIVLTNRVVDGLDLDAVEMRVRASAPAAPVYRGRLVPSGWSTLTGDPVVPPTGEALAVAAVADPAQFVGLLKEQGLDVELARYPDHHEYTESEWATCVRRAQRRPILTTEKDAVKLRSLAESGSDVRVLRLEFEIQDADILMKRVLTSIGR